MSISKAIRQLTTRGAATVVLSGVLIAFSLLLGWVGVSERFSRSLMLAAAVAAGLPVALAAWRSIKARHVSIELLVTVAAVGAVIIGEVWEAAAVTFLFDLGGYLESRTMARTRRVIGELLDVAPTMAVVLRDGEEVETSPSDVSPGEIVLVRPGSKIPVDGVVISGRSRVDQSAITGESYPASKTDGEDVYAGTFNQTGMLKVEATGVGADTTLARVVQRVEEAQEAKAPTQRFMERFARWYTPAIILLAALSALITGDIELGLTVLVIGCPGALVISTPVSVVAGIGGAAREGILMKGGAHLEKSGKITAVALDKTGTLTEGRPEVINVLSLSQEDPLYWAAAAERGSEHPVAGAILRKAEGLGAIPEPDSVEAIPGKGIRGEVSGREVLVGTERLMEERGISREAEGMIAEARNFRGSPVYVALDGVLLGALQVADPVRGDAREAVERLRAAGVRRLVMLTGDSRSAAEEVAREIGLEEVLPELLPEEKLEAIEKLRREGYVTAMVGDGINDAPALAAADIGIALGSAGTDVAIETADIALMRDDLLLVAKAADRARKTLANIRQNVVIAVSTVAALLAGVLLGEVHMAGGMLVHEVSVLIVILNGMRLLGMGEKERRLGSTESATKPLQRDAA